MADMWLVNIHFKPLYSSWHFLFTCLFFTYTFSCWSINIFLLYSHKFYKFCLHHYTKNNKILFYIISVLLQKINLNVRNIFKKLKILISFTSLFSYKPPSPHCLFFVQRTGQRLFLPLTNIPTSMHSTFASRKFRRKF